METPESLLPRGGHTVGGRGAVTMSVCRRSGEGMDQSGVRTAQGANAEPAGAAPLWVRGVSETLDVSCYCPLLQKRNPDRVS